MHTLDKKNGNAFIIKRDFFEYYKKYLRKCAEYSNKAIENLLAFKRKCRETCKITVQTVYFNKYYTIWIDI